MLPVIFTVLAVFVFQTLLPASLRYVFAGPGTAMRLKAALGPRDEQPALSAMAARAQRALQNMHEALPVFLTLALLLVFRGVEGGTALQGAWLFAIARIVYVPAYLSGVFGLRSAVWMASWVGLIIMLVALLD